MARGATIVGIDADAAMLTAVEASLDPDRTTLVQQRLEAPLPTGPSPAVRWQHRDVAVISVPTGE